MADPYEYRELLKAAFNWSDKTVDQVSAEFKNRRDADTPEKSGGKKSVSTGSDPKKSEVDKLNALLANAKPRERTDMV